MIIFWYIDSILIDKNSDKNILIYDISWALIASEPLRIKFNRIDGFIKIYDGTRYLTLFGLEKYYAFCDKIRYLANQKNDTTYIFSHTFAKVKVDSNDSLLIGKILTLNYFIILIKWVIDKYKTHYY